MFGMIESVVAFLGVIGQVSGLEDVVNTVGNALFVVRLAGSVGNISFTAPAGPANM